MFKRKNSLLIKGVEYKFDPNSLRAAFMFESMSGKSYSKIETAEDNFMMLYCVFKSCNRDKFDIDFDDFIDFMETKDGHKVLEQISKIAVKKL